MVQHNMIIGVEGEKIMEKRGSALAGEDPGSLPVHSTVELIFANLRLNPPHLLLHHSPKQLLAHSHSHAISIQLRSVLDPLPALHSADLRRRSVFHQVVKRHRTCSAQPRRQVLDSHAGVQPQPFHGSNPSGPLQQVFFCQLRSVFSLGGFDLVRGVRGLPLHLVIREHLHAYWDEPRVSCPCSIVPCFHLSQLVLPHQIQSCFVCNWVVFYRNLSSLFV